MITLIGDDVTYSKASSLQLYLFGLEFSDSLVLITRNNFYFMASAKKCAYLQEYLLNKHDTIKIHIYIRSKDEGLNREYFNELANIVRKNNGIRLGSLYKQQYEGSFVSTWFNFVEQSQLDKVDITQAVSYLLSVKDEKELVSSRIISFLILFINIHTYMSML